MTMDMYKFRAYTAEGDDQAGELEARDLKSAKQQLHHQGLLAYEISKIETSFVAATKGSDWFKLTPAKPSQLQIAEFTKFLAILLRSGMDLDQCLQHCESQVASSLQPTLIRIRKAVVSGKSLSGAMEAQSEYSANNTANILPRALIIIVRAGEASGKLAETLTSYSSSVIQRQKIYSEITTSMVYPIIILTMSVVAIGVISIFLVPAILPIFEQSDTSLPLIIAILVIIQEFIGNQILLLSLLLLFAVLAVTASFRTEAGLRSLQNVLVRIPFVGKLLLQSEQSKIFDVLAVLLDNKVELTKALEISADVSFLKSLGDSMREVTTSVREGQRFSTNMKDHAQFSQLACRMIAIGEETNQLGKMLRELSGIQSTLVKEKLERFVTLLTPVITISMGVLIGALMIGTMQAILSINELAL
ncbi:MAG: type II secretion system F family protein [Hyphomicrobiales bacterium]|nr:type II secretion system F family protein [Hyphomicrobiales bacterium]